MVNLDLFHVAVRVIQTFEERWSWFWRTMLKFATDAFLRISRLIDGSDGVRTDHRRKDELPRAMIMENDALCTGTSLSGFQAMARAVKTMSYRFHFMIGKFFQAQEEHASAVL
uniref:Uncharacterized protein n=1 Tax=Spongospora subterranea TaxID=70186 RepID=A0A0H5RF53_9EUKA|eukprot:CRZ07254.1 hypothetical protein [Spongospora subterranea]